MPKAKPKLIIIVGPTASGKSALGVKLARELEGEIISADSRQVYKGMDIGTGKVTKKEMHGVPHHLLDVASPKGIYTAARFRKDAQRALKDIVRRGKLPIIVGGTSFYIDALLYNTLLPDVKPSPKLRNKLERLSATELFRILQKKDPVRAASIDPHNKRRLVRALEIIQQTRSPVPPPSPRTHSNVLQNVGISKDAVMKIGISRKPEELRKRIRERLSARMKQGMLAEVRHLHASGLSWKRLDDLGLEYRWLSRHLRGVIPRDEMLRRLESEIWRYARRQMTWWRRDKDIRWISRTGELKL